MNMLKSYMSKDTGEFKKLILDNPDLPIIVFAGEGAHCGDYYWMLCTSISFGIEEILDCDYTDYDDVIIQDRGRLKERIMDDLYDEYSDKPDEEYEEAIKREMEKYEPFWKKVIAIYADN